MDFSDYEKIRTKLCVEVLNRNQNKDILKKIPHVNLKDLAIVYSVQQRMITESGKKMIMGNYITNQMMADYGISREQLHADAMESVQRLHPVIFRSLEAVTAEITAEITGNPVPINTSFSTAFVVSNQEHFRGASALFYPGFMDQAVENIGGNFYILPSSIHEVLIVPDRLNMKTEELESIVRSVNLNTVEASERLSDHVYHYDGETHIFELGKEYDAVTKEKKKEKTAERPDRKKIDPER